MPHYFTYATMMPVPHSGKHERINGPDIKAIHRKDAEERLDRMAQKDNRYCRAEIVGVLSRSYDYERRAMVDHYKEELRLISQN